MSTFLRYPQDVDLAIFHNNLWVLDDESGMANSTWLFLPINPTLESPFRKDDPSQIGPYGTVIMTFYLDQTVQDVFLWSVTPEGQLKILAVDSVYGNSLFAIKSLSSEELVILETPAEQPPETQQLEMVLRRISPPDRVVINSESR